MKRLNNLLLITLLILSIAFYGFNILRSVFIDTGVSDEGFLLNQVNGRSIDGIKDWYLPFSDFLTPIWSISDGNLPVYRTLGLLIFFILLLPSIFLTITRKHWILTTIFIINFAFSGLALSRYLLVTPGYQNLILIASVSSVIPLVFIITRQPKAEIKNMKIMIFLLLYLAINLLLITSSRISGGAAYLAAIWVVFSLNLKQRHSFIFLGVITLPVLAFFIFDINNWQQRIKFSVKIAQIVDPSGYSIKSEVIDFVQPTIPILIAFAIGIILSQPKSQFKMFYLTLLSTVGLASIALGINRIGILLICITTVSIYQEFGKSYPIRLLLSFFIISLIPFWSVFGSNTPAVGNLHFILIGIVFLLLGLNKISTQLSETHEMKSFKVMLPKFQLLTLVPLIYFGIVTENSGYGKSLSDWSLDRHNLTIKASNFTIKALDRPNASRQNLGTTRILDLSYFHPGIIYKLGGIQYPVSLSDYKYKSTVKRQLSEIHKYVTEIDAKGAEYVLVKLKNDSSRSCVYLSELVEDRELMRELNAKSWTGKYFVEKTVQVKGLNESFGLARLCHLR